MMLPDFRDALYSVGHIRSDGPTKHWSTLVEFVDESEALDALKALGIKPVAEGEEFVLLKMLGASEIVHLHIAGEDAAVDPVPGAEVLTVPADQLSAFIEHMLARLHLTQVLLVPIGKWRGVFDAVAFSLAGNEDWQEVDAAASVELNRRDPLLCEAGDFQTLIALIGALLSDAEGAAQSLILTTTTAPLIVEVVPEGALRFELGSRVLADEVMGTFEAHR